MRTGDRRGPRRRAVEARPRAIWLYGRHTVLAALANPERRLSRLVVARDFPDLPGTPRLPPERLPREMLAALLPPGAVHQGIAALAEPLPEVALEDVLDGPLVVVLDQVTDPHNVGAVLRSAAVFGARAVVMQERNAPEPTGILAKSASGALEVVPLVRVVNLARALETLKQAGFWCLGLDVAAQSTLAAVPPAAKRALVLGAEGAGMRRLVRETCDEVARIDGPGPITSLNVSNAAAVALYALSRNVP